MDFYLAMMCSICPVLSRTRPEVQSILLNFATQVLVLYPQRRPQCRSTEGFSVSCQLVMRNFEYVHVHSICGVKSWMRQRGRACQRSCASHNMD